MIHNNTAWGFTLLEILISLFILAVIAVMITTGLDLTVKTQLRVEKKYKLLAEVQLALTTMERDLQEVTDRPILDENGLILAAFQISGNRLEFTRSGFINPFSMNKRSTLQRVAYTLEGDQLVRSVWPALDRAPSSTFEDKILLHQVKDFNIQVITSPLPPTSAGTAGQSTLTNQGVIIEMMIEELGYVKRVFAIPSNNFEISHVETA